MGGGASGFFCAVNAATMNPDLKVVILEKTSKVLSKVKASGGGRCNVTHACYERSEMTERYPRGKSLLKKSFYQFFTKDTIEWFASKGIQLKEEKDGRMFPVSNTSQTIIDCLLQEATMHKVQVLLNRSVSRVEKLEDDFQIHTNHGESIAANFVVIACGGFPKLESYDWIRNLGHTIIPPVPSLFTFNLPGHSIHELMGVSVPEARVKLLGGKLEASGPLLITHWGLSGPAILKLSAWAARQLAESQWNFKVLIQWDVNLKEDFVRGTMAEIRTSIASQKISTKCPFGLPSRLWMYLLSNAGISSEMRWADLPSKEQNLLIKHICSFEVEVKGKTTFKEEFVTAGGVSLSDIDPQTMMSKRVPHLFFTGEVMDVDGITGGYNFQNAWTSGWIAAKEIARLAFIEEK